MFIVFLAKHSLSVEICLKMHFKNLHFQGNWHDLSEFFEYATEWEPSACLYFGDNVLQVHQLYLCYNSY